MRLSEAALDRIRAALLAERERLPTVVEPSDFLDNLVGRLLRRYPALLELEDDEDGPEEVEVEALPGGVAAATAYVRSELQQAAASPYFPLVQQVAITGDDQAIEQLMALLDRHLKLRGLLYRHGLDPDKEYPAIWGKVWEVIPKWDGRDFRAYVARTVRNLCLDDISRKKRAPGSIDAMDGVEPRDPRPSRQTAEVSSARDAMEFVKAVLDDLEASGRIKALDGVMFALISEGRSVADIVTGFRTSDVPIRFQAAIEELGKRTNASDAAVMRFLVDGLTPDEAAALTGRAERDVQRIANALGPVAELEDEDRLLARTLSREGLATKDLERARGLTTNAVNLCLNRIRLKVWMALVDRAYESLRRRKAITAAELAVVQHRCEHAPPAGCRLYKDRTCKRERDAAGIARKGGLDMDAAAVGHTIEELRRKVIEDGLGLVFPDYNACLIERKPLKN